MAIAAFLCSWDVLVGFTGGCDAIMTTAAGTEYFGVIDKAYDAEAQRRVAGLTQITGRDMRAGLDENRCIRIVDRMTLNTIARESPVKVVGRRGGIGSDIRIEGGIVKRHHQGHCTRA